MFDVAAVAVLLIALWRSSRARFAWGVVAAVVSVALIVGAGASAIESRDGEGDVAVPLGIFFVGPGAVLHDRDGALALFASPIAIAALGLTLTGSAAWVADRRRAELYPESPEARRLCAIAGAFVGAASFAAIRLVIALMYRLMTGAEI